MTDAQMLEALIDEAKKRGYEFSGKYFGEYVGVAEPAVLIFRVPNDHLRMPWAVPLLADHDFARALFGEKPHEFDPNMIIMETPPIEWMYQLQRAVISDNPIKYMYDAVFKV